MARTVYYVVKHEGKWKIRLNNKHEGSFANHASAVRAAIATAYKAAKEGSHALVLSRNWSNWQTEWVY